ncbi:PKD domain-containing protein [Patescibacteria group bacterium]|nr:PKD domain-containing protein [Patescibacteria group bacterium]
MEDTTPQPQNPNSEAHNPEQQATPSQPQTEQTPPPVPTPGTVTEQTPQVPQQDKNAKKPVKKGSAFKRLLLMLGLVFLLLFVFEFVWASTLAKGSALDKLILTVTNIQCGILVGASLLYALFGLLKSLLAKKDPLKKKKATKTALVGGVFFLLSALLWLFAVIYLPPRLTPEQQYVSYILTDPAVTLGLTAPIEVEFDASQIPVDTNAFRVLSYTWNFGDGGTANGPTVSHRFIQKPPNGTYNVVLKVSFMDLKTGEQLSEEFTTVVGIENEEVAAIFTATPSSGNVPLDVEFNASSSYDPDGEIVAYDWDFDGDGSYDDASGVIVSYTFEQEGEFTVGLRVTDNNGQYATTAYKIEAGSVGGLRAVISAPLQTDETYKTGEKYKFSGELSQIREGEVVKYVWDFGDKSDTIQSRTATHEFTKSGDYEVSLTVFDVDGNSHTATLEIKVVEQGTPPSAKIKTSPAAQNNVTSGAVPFEVSFDASSSTDPEDDIVEYEWDFNNDGVIDDSGDKVTYTYEEVGVYEAKLIVTDAAGNSNTITIGISVEEQGIVARLSANVTNGEAPLTVTFDASSSSYKEGNIVSYEYDFGDGSDVHVGGAKISYKYINVGNFTVKLTAIGEDGTKDTTTMQIVVRPVEITACFTVNTDSGSAPLFVAVDPICSKGTIRSYVWDFDDGEISFDRKPDIHTYSEPGTYTISLEVTSEDRTVDVFEKTITVR